MKFLVTEYEMGLLVRLAAGDPEKLQSLEDNYLTYQRLEAPIIVWPSTIEKMHRTTIALQRKRGWLLS